MIRHRIRRSPLEVGFYLLLVFSTTRLQALFQSVCVTTDKDHHDSLDPATQCVDLRPGAVDHDIKTRVQVAQYRLVDAVVEVVCLPGKQEASALTSIQELLTRQRNMLFSAFIWWSGDAAPGE